MTAALSVLSPVPAVLDGLPVAIDRDEVLRFQGYKKDVDVPSAQVLAIFEEALALGRSLLTPRVVYRAIAVTGGGADRIDAGGERLHIPQIARLCGPIEAVGAGICTVGEAIEGRVRQLFDAREFPLAVMLDSVGSAAAESLANRISPGYAGWDTAEQAALFRLCPGDPIGVRLNEACFMTPGKSISWLVGIGPDARVDHYFTQCRRCWMRDCAYRRAPAVSTVQEPGGAVW